MIYMQEITTITHGGLDSIRSDFKHKRIITMLVNYNMIDGGSEMLMTRFRVRPVYSEVLSRGES